MSQPQLSLYEDLSNQQLQSEINEIVKRVMGGKSTSLSFHKIELGINKMVLLRCLRLSKLVD